MPTRTVIHKTVVKHEIEKKFAECKDTHGCTDFYTTGSFAQLKPAENYYLTLEDCNPTKCVKGTRCWEATGCGDYHTALSADKQPQGVFALEKTDECKAQCKKYVRCDEKDGCKDYWSSLPVDQLPKNVFQTTEECQKSCQNIYKCKCEGKCDNVYVVDPSQPFFKTEKECTDSKECYNQTCANSVNPFVKRWMPLIVFGTLLLGTLLFMLYGLLIDQEQLPFAIAPFALVLVFLGGPCIYYYASGDYMK